MLPLRSVNHNESAYVQFQNHTQRYIDVVWINYTGECQKYITLKPRENVNIDTFKTHPWIFVDRKTGVRMRVGLNTVFYPFSNSEIIQRFGLNQDQNIPIRIPIPISLPVFSLRYISLQNVASLLNDENDIDNLELPQILKRDIRRFCREKNEILSKYH